MNTATFIVPPRSPLQQAMPRSRPKTFMTVFLVVIAHVILFLVLLFPGSRHRSWSDSDSINPSSRPALALPTGKAQVQSAFSGPRGQ